MEKLTPREKEVLAAVIRLRRAQGYPPTLEEIGVSVGIGSRAGVHRHVRALEKKGYLERGPGRRCLKVLRDLDGRPVPSSEEMTSIPRYDRVRGGPTDFARSDIEDFISVPMEWLRGEQGFAVQVVGNSMAPNLMDGDLVIIRSRAVAQNGDIVVALVDDETTVKRLRQLRDRVLLVPENPGHKTLEFPGGVGVKILGKVVHSIRAFR